MHFLGERTKKSHKSYHCTIFFNKKVTGTYLMDRGAGPSENTFY